MATQPVQPVETSGYIDSSEYERIDGRLVKRAVPGAIHAETQFQVTVLLKPWAAALNAEVHQEWSIHRSKESKDYMTPDVMMSFPGPYERNHAGHLIAPALLCVEVVSPDQSVPYLIEKAERYFEWGCPHCWIVDPETQVCLEYHGANTVVIAKEFLTAGQVQIKVSDLFPNQSE